MFKFPYIKIVSWMVSFYDIICRRTLNGYLLKGGENDEYEKGNTKIKRRNTN